jgi:hypothetical protein
MTQDPRAHVTLTIGSHLAPQDGLCLMEAVSIAAGLPFSDAPTCTPPLLAHLARLVNDASSTAARQELSALIPALAAASEAASPDDHLRAPDLDAAIQLVCACTEYALGLHGTPLLRHFHAVAVWLRERDQRLRRPWRRSIIAQRAMAATFLRGPAPRALEAAVTACLALSRGERDLALAGLLRTGLTASLQPATAASCTREARCLAPAPR